jgi:diacylglycerol kinase (ATP)
MTKYIVIHNKNSRGRQINKSFLEKLFIKNNLPFEMFQTLNSNEVKDIIKKYNEPSKFIYCAVGGDGTLSNLIDTLLSLNIEKPKVAFLPTGSGSDFIRTFALPQNIEDAFQHLLTDTFYEIDVGCVKTKKEVRHFINVLNVGFLANTVKLSEFLPKFFRRFRYPISFWIKIINAKPSQIDLKTDRSEFSSNAFNICVCNGQFFGGGWNISPKSSLQDGILDVQIFAVNKLKAMKIFFLAKKGLHLREENVIVKKTSSIILNSKVGIELDGDFLNNGPAEIFVKKRAFLFKI